MNAKLWTAPLLCLLLLAISVNAAGYARSTTVQGGFCSGPDQSPVPGLMVSLAHPQLGRSQPAYTNEFGYFQMYNIPIHQVPYYLEVYWGQRLIYRSQIVVQGPVNLGMTCI